MNGTRSAHRRTTSAPARAAMLVGAWVLAAGAAVAAQPPIRVANFRDGQTVRHPVVLLAGSLADAKLDAVTVLNASSKLDTRELTGLAHQGRFKALAELVPGENRIAVRAGKDETALKLQYKPQTNPCIVRVAYFTDRTGAADYQTPLADDAQDWRGKLETAMKLMQCFTAERMNDAGFGRVTFNLELGAGNKVDVHLVKGPRDAAHYRGLDGGQLYGEVGREVARQLPRGQAKTLVVPAMTRWDANTGRALAHTALGGGNLALFGGGDLFTWPNSLAEAQAAFGNAAPVDPKRYFSDSVGRHTFWATCSTTMGAALHELGHTFGLPHSREAHDMMTRGHDRFNRFFTLVEPPHARRKQPYEFKDDEIAAWAPVSAGALAPHRFFAMDDRPWRDPPKAVIRLDRETNRIVVESDCGVRYVGLTETGEGYGTHAVAILAPKEAAGPAGPPRRIDLPLAELTRRRATGKLGLKVMDAEGLTTHTGLQELLAGPYVQAWQFAAATEPWQDTGKFVNVDAARLEAIAASAAKANLTRSAEPYVDFLTLSGSRRGSHVAGYAVRTIRSDKPRTIRLHTGSDDALRMWLNGKLIAGVLALRGATADSETTDSELRAGQNTLVVEVSQGIGGWGLILRIADADGTKLNLTDDGRLVPVRDDEAGQKAE